MFSLSGVCLDCVTLSHIVIHSDDSQPSYRDLLADLRRLYLAVSVMIVLFLSFGTDAQPSGITGDKDNKT